MARTMIEEAARNDGHDILKQVLQDYNRRAKVTGAAQASVTKRKKLY
jgi:hypothetical protein